MAKERRKKKESARAVKKAYEILDHEILPEYQKRPDANKLLIQELDELVQAMRKRALELL